MLRYRDLTPEQKAVICNGCGRKGGWLDPPDFMFTASCDQHDFYYWRGYKESDRLEADRAFLRAMRRDIAQLPWYRRPLAHAAAWIYYRAVRRCGRRAFHYGRHYRNLIDAEIAAGEKT